MLGYPDIWQDACCVMASHLDASSVETCADTCLDTYSIHVIPYCAISQIHPKTCPVLEHVWPPVGTPILSCLVLFNVRVGSNTQYLESVIGPHGIGKMKSNGLLLLSMCTENNLTITNTLFTLADKYKTKWIQLRYKEWHLIDYVIFCRWEICDVKIMRAMWGAEYLINHRLVNPQSRHCTTSVKKPKMTRIPFNTEKLKHTDKYHWLAGLPWTTNWRPKWEMGPV